MKIASLKYIMELKEYKEKVMPLKNQMFRYAKRLIGNYEDAEEIVQEALIKMWQKRDSIKTDSNIAAFAMVVTRNLCLDKMRSKHYKHKGVNFDALEYDIRNDSISPELLAEYKDANELINKIISEFPEKWRTVIQLRDIEGFTNKEVAEMTGMEINVIKITLSRVRKRIRDILINKYNYDYNERKN